MIKSFTKYILTLVAILMATSNAWAQSPNFQENKWYSLYDPYEHELKVTITSFQGEWEFLDVFSPAQTNLTFDAKRSAAGSGTLNVAPIIDGTQQSNIFSQNPGKVTKKFMGIETSVDYTDTPYSATTPTNLTQLKFYTPVGATGSKFFKNIKLPLAEHILLNNNTSFGTTTLDAGNQTSLATSVGVRSTSPYTIPLRSFFTKSGTITITSTNSEFHFSDGKAEKKITLPTNNFCVSSSASGSPGNNWKGISDFHTTYNTQIYFTPSGNTNGTRSTTITISDGTNSATITLTAPVKPTYYFKAAAIAYTTDNAGNTTESTIGGTATAKFNNNGGGSTCTIITDYNTDYATTSATYTATPNEGYVFDGWKTSPDATEYVSRNLTMTTTTQPSIPAITSSELSEPTEPQQTYYAMFVQKYNPEITGTTSYTKKVDETWDVDFNFVKTATAVPVDATVYPDAPFVYEITNNFNGNNIHKPGYEEAIITYNPTEKKITAHNAGTATLTIRQKLTNTHNEKVFTCTITVSKYDSEFAWKIENNSEYLIDQTITKAELFSRATDNDLPVTIKSSNTNAVTVDNNGTLNAIGAGTAIITVAQTESYKWLPISEQQITIIINKHKPVFTWNPKGITPYYDTKYADYTGFFESSSTKNNDGLQLTSTSSDPQVAILEAGTDAQKLDLKTFNKPGTTKLTVTQSENWYWAEWSDSYEITPQDPNNHVPFDLKNDNKERYNWQTVNDQITWNDGGWFDENKNNITIQFGNNLNTSVGNDGYNGYDLWFIIGFTGIPDKLQFITQVGGSSKPQNGDVFFYICEGATLDEVKNASPIKTISERTIPVDQQLSPTTRFIKIGYKGSYRGWIQSLRVTELEQFNVITPANKIIDFGTGSTKGYVNRDLELKYANAGYQAKIEWEDEHIYINGSNQSPYMIQGIGGEQEGETSMVVSFGSSTPYNIPEGSKLIITDELGNIQEVTLKGKIDLSAATLTWRSDFNVAEPVVLPLETGVIADAVTSTRVDYDAAPILYSSSDPTVIEIVNEGKAFRPIALGEATITATQEGDGEEWKTVSTSKKFHISGKKQQYIQISASQNLTNLYVDGEPVTLTATVYEYSIADGSRVERNPQPTVIFSSQDDNIVSIEGNTLIIKGKGTTTITATVEESEESDYITSTAIEHVQVRLDGECPDIYLLDPQDEYEFYKFDLSKPQLESPIYEINTDLGVVGILEFEHRGAQYWTGNYRGTLNAQWSTDKENWKNVEGSTVTPPKSSEWATASNIKLDPTAKYIKIIRPADNEGYHYITNVRVLPLQYIKTDKETINFTKIPLGSTNDFDFTISYAGIKGPVTITCPDNDVTLQTTTFGDCNEFGEIIIQGQWIPNKGQGTQTRTITIADEKANMTATVVLSSEVTRREQKIIWNDEDKPAGNIVNENTDLDKRPLTTNVGLPVSYSVKEGDGNEFAYFDENGMFIIIKEGEFTVTAYNGGNDLYLPVEAKFTFNAYTTPHTFLGTEDNNWFNTNNWNLLELPESSESATIIKPVEITNNDITISELRVASTGSVHITSAGGLTVGKGGIQCSKTDGSAIVIDNLYTGAGFLRVDPTYEGTMPRITMRYETRSTLDNGANKDAEWQYIGAPGLNSTIYVDYNTWLYKLDEPNNNWVLQPRVDSVSLDPFEGYAITQYGKPIYEWTADMTTEDCTIPLTYSKNGRGGRHIIANSYTAPINVAAFTGDEFQFLEGMSTKYRIEQTLYIFNSGSWNNWHEQDSLGTGTYTDGTNTPGQYYAIPVLAARENYLEGLQTTIAPMQGIYLRVRSLTPLDQLPEAGEQVGNLVLNYEQLVMGSEHQMHRPMRAPQRTTSSAMQDPNFRRVRIVATSENSGADRVYIIQDNINTRKYNNGYDATNQETKGLVNIYTNETGGKMEVSCSNNIDSMYIGFMAGSDHTYTLHFSAIIGDILYLQDLDNGQKISIVEGGSYTFEAEPQSTNHKRFLLLTSQGVSTGTDEVALANIWYRNKALHITNAPNNSTLTLYDISGHQLLSTTIQETPYTLDLSHLTEGIYIARLNNQVYKFVCK